MNKKYQIVEQLYESSNSLVHRGFLSHNHQPVILKILKENYPTPSELIRYRQEYQITSFFNVDNIIKAYDLQRYENSLVMFLEDFGGHSLELLLNQNRFDLEEFLKVAIKTTEALDVIHKANIIHKDINPSNIIYNQKTKQLKIIDFGLSSQLAQEFITVFSPHQLEGTLAYIAPEQTGRMNRGIDYRSDFYALGVTFYQLLTQKLPFETTDLIELVHCHIAQHPLPVHKLVSDIPLPVSNLITKLLAKTPEERYQSAWGIKNDLNTCLNQLQKQQQIELFTLAKQDIRKQFHIPYKLYGRKSEVQKLLTVFTSVSQGASELILVSGYSGIGKTALVNEIYQPITRKKGQVIRGKFDQLQKNIPYSAITQAFQDLIKQLLSEPQKQLKIYHDKILKALGNNAQIIIDVIPELEKLIGKQPAVEQLGKTESQNRFNLFFKRFLMIFCRLKHPLVVFIDDLQWADLSSLSLIEQLICDPDINYFLLIGAYRDNEISATHPLTHTLEKIEQHRKTIHTIALSALKTKEINQLIADTLSCNTKLTQPLAELIKIKTLGNPFFLTQLLYYLYEQKLLFLKENNELNLIKNTNKSYWRWNIQKIKNLSITDNVIDLMVCKIEKLSSQTQHVLKLASCISNQFNLEVLAIINHKSEIVTAQELQPALDEGLVIPLDNNYKIPLVSSTEDILNDQLGLNTSNYSSNIYYKFLHDRVQQAAYSLISSAEKRQFHLQIGQILLENYHGNKLEEKIFDIVNQLNEGVSLITEQSQKKQLANLNLLAGKKAKASTAYDSALKYLEIGLELLALDSWKDDYDFTLELHIETLEALYLNTQFARIEELSTTILNTVTNIFDRLKVYKINIIYCFSVFQPQKAIDIALSVLPKLGINISLDQKQIEKRITNRRQSIKRLLKNKSIEEDLANSTPMTEPKKLASVAIILTILSPSNVINFPLFIELILILSHLCIKYGTPPQADVIYSYYGMLLCGVMDEIEYGYEFGKLAMYLVEKHNNSQLKQQVFFLYYCYIWCWKNPINDRLILTKLLDSLQQGMNGGHNEFVGLLSQGYCTIKFLAGNQLEEVEKDCEKYIQFVEKLNQEYSRDFLQVLQSITKNLSNNNYEQDILLLANTKEKENQSLQKYLAQNNQWLLFIYYFGKTINCYILKRFFDSLQYSQETEKYVAVTSGGILLKVYQNFYYSLACLAYYSNYDQESEQGKDLLKTVTKNQKQMAKWSDNCQINFQHKYDLVEAEKARILGKYWKAQDFYEKAIKGAKNNKFIQEEALAYERASEFYLAIDREEIGTLYLRNALHCYIRWGAKAKVKQLEKQYPQYLLGIRNNSSKKTTTLVSTINNNGEILDLTTIIKASQAISGEIKLESLLHNLMKIVIENAGAQKGYLILKQGGNWVIEAKGAINQETVNILQSIPIESTEEYDDSIPILPTSIINYVTRTAEPIVLNNATIAEQFMNDPYIIAQQPLSILCTPLPNQNQLSGIVYLENNLTTGAFTKERIQLLNILATQAAISIDNSRLYQNLEQRVEERTKELTQTLDVLKATQAELIFENEFLRNSEKLNNFVYHVGGSLPMNAPTYVVRQADRNFHKALSQGKFCYVLNARQMGKSSLMVQTIHRLQKEGVKCVVIDLTRIGTEEITIEQWYKGLAVDLLRNFGLIKQLNNFKTWWNEQLDIPCVQRLGQFVEKFLLVSINQSSDKVVIFIDEIDSVLALKFNVSDFFALVRSFYNQRAIQPDSKFNNLSFAFFGATTPSHLINEPRKTPFNIGQAIKLESFKEHEAQPLLYGLNHKIKNPQTMLRQVISWTGGQPFLTQKLCQLIRESSIPISLNQETHWLANLVEQKIIIDWEMQDQPEHLKTISDRILKSPNRVQLLTLYQQILQQKEISFLNNIHLPELFISGLVVKDNNIIRVHNRIYQTIFDYDWIKRSLRI